MTVDIELVKNLDVNSKDIIDLLFDVYVSAGYVSRRSAETLFTVDAIQNRGQILVARDNENAEIIGCVISSMSRSLSKFVNKAYSKKYGIRNSFAGS